MKKMLAVLLSVLMAFTLVTVNVAADTYNKGRSGFWWNKLNTKKVEEAKEEDVEEATEKLNEEVDAEDVEEKVEEKTVVEETEVLEEDVEEEPTWIFVADQKEKKIVATRSIDGEVQEACLQVRDSDPNELVYNYDEPIIGFKFDDAEFKEFKELTKTEPTMVYYDWNYKLDGAPTNAGKYTVKVGCEGAYVSVDFVVSKKVVNEEEELEKARFSHTYSGEVQDGLKLDQMEVDVVYDNGTLLHPYVNKATNAGNYTGCIKLADPRNFEWTNSKTNSIEYIWSIEPLKLDYNGFVNSFNREFTYNARLQQPELPFGLEYAVLGNIPFVTKYDCIAIDQGRYTALVKANEGNVFWSGDTPFETVDLGLLGKQKCVPFTWHIARKEITTASVINATKVYGDKDPVFEVEIPEAYSKVDELAIRALRVRFDSREIYNEKKGWTDVAHTDKGERVGEHIIKANDNGKDYTNYDLTNTYFETGILTITKAPLNFRLSSKEKEYDGYKFRPELKISGLKRADHLAVGVDYTYVRYDAKDEGKYSFDNQDHTTAEVGEKICKVRLINPDGTIYNYEVGNEVTGNVITFEYEISEPVVTPKDAPKVPTAREAKAIVIRTVTSIIRNLSTKRFGR